MGKRVRYIFFLAKNSCQIFLEMLASHKKSYVPYTFPYGIEGVFVSLATLLGSYPFKSAGMPSPARTCNINKSQQPRLGSNLCQYTVHQEQRALTNHDTLIHAGERVDGIYCGLQRFSRLGMTEVEILQ